MGPKHFAATVTASQPTSLERIKIGKAETYDARWGDGTRAVVKFSRTALPNGKKAQRGISAESQPRREVAFWKMAELYGWDDLVPETVLATIEGSQSSVQAWVAAESLAAYREALRNRTENPNWNDDLLAATKMIPEEQWLRLVVLDFIAGARDRHSNNVGVRFVLKADGPATFGLVAWDNSVTFGKTLRLYHQVFHKRIFRDTIDLEPIWGDFVKVDDARLASVLEGLVSQEEIEHACVRRRFLEDFPYKMPWKVLSCGEEGDGFPPHEHLFRTDVAPLPLPH